MKAANKNLENAFNIADKNAAPHINITYTNIKTNRTVTGFHFTAKSPYYMNMSELSLETQETLNRINEKQKEKNIV